MAKPNITALYDKVFEVKEMLTEVINTAMEAANDAEAFGGEVSRVVTGQLRSGLIPAVQQYIDEENNQASMSSLISFLDSVPLAWVRQGPEQMPGTTTGADVIEAPQQQQPQAPGNPTAPAPAPEQQQPMPAQESAILKSKEDDPVRATLRENWEREHEEKPMKEGELDFRNFKEGYVEASTPTQLQPSSEDRVYKRVLEKAYQPKETERLDEDFIGSPYKAEEVTSAESFADWRKLMDNTDKKIEEALHE